MITRRKFLTSTVLASLYGSGSAVFTSPSVLASDPSMPWRNWSGALSANPKNRIAPLSEDELVEKLKLSSGALRPVGAGHSFSPLVPTDGTLIVLDKLSGLIGFDKKSRQATFAAGTRLGNTGPLLEGIGQAMINLPDIDRQTIAGAIATSTHGTGLQTGSLSKYITALRLVTPQGEVYDLSRDSQADLFDAARVSLGALGVITRVTFQNRDSFSLKSQTWVEPTQDVIESFNERMNQYEHYEFLPFSHSDYSLVIAHSETHNPLLAPPPAEDAGDLFALISMIPVSLRKPVINFLVSSLEASESVEASHLALTNVRNDRFNEMEYSIPIDSGLPCLKEVLQTISDHQVDVVIPLEYRVIASDDTWLGMCTSEAKASISIHRMAGYDYRPYFDLIEPIFWKYGGRPHWGKVHSLGYKQLAALYPRMEDFIEVQKNFDPEGQMLNPHLRKLFGFSKR